MSRSGYSEDCDDQWAAIRWRGAVKSAMRGRRGQAFLKEMLASLDAMPIKRLVSMALEADGDVCAIGAVGKARGVDMSGVDPENFDLVAHAFGIATPMAQEIVYMNDEYWNWSTDEKGQPRKDADGKWIRITPEERFTRMRAWVAGQILPEAVAA